MSKSQKTMITRTDYLKLMGLLELARGHNAALKDIERAAREITGESVDAVGGGHTGDAVACDYTADELLGKLRIKVRGLGK